MFPRHSFVSLACFCFFGALSFPWRTFVSLARFHFIGLFLFPSQALGFLKAAKICFLTAAKLCFLDTLLFPWHALNCSRQRDVERKIVRKTNELARQVSISSTFYIQFFVRKLFFYVPRLKAAETMFEQKICM